MNGYIAHNAYQTTNGMVRKTQQVVMLYDGVIRFVQQAKQAIEDNDIQERYNSLSKACEVINGLQLSLDMERGGQVAELLYDYYASIDMRLLSIHQSQNIPLLESCIDNLKTMREAWIEIDEQEALKEESERSSDGAMYDPQIAEKLTANPTMSAAEFDALAAVSVSV